MQHLSHLIFLDCSPLGVRTRDLPHGLVDSSRRSMVVCFAHLPPILPPTRANRDEYWRTAQRQVVTGLDADTNGSRQEFAPGPHVVGQVERHRRRALIVDAARRAYGLR